MERIFADFNNADKRGRVRLNCDGSIKDIERSGVKLLEGKEIQLSDGEDLETKGILHYSKEENIWVAEIDWDNLSTKV
jgi:hypothetical protein